MVLRNLLIAVMVTAGLTACRGIGFDQFDTGNFWTTETPEKKQEESWWDNYWGRKKSGHESAAWKDYYTPINEGPERYQNCGYWGSDWQNCRGMTPPTATPNCDFYGNCKPATSGSGW